jgi:hypothetical protein
MVNRLVGALALTVALSACRETQPAGPLMFVGLGGVRVEDAHIVPSREANTMSAGGGHVSYVVVHLELTNGSAAELIPEIERFVLADRFGNRFSGIDSGSAALLGIANPRGPLPPGATREYIVAFRVTDPTVAGNIAYEP